MLLATKRVDMKSASGKLPPSALAMVVWILPKCPAWRPNCLAIWVQQAQLGSAASLGGQS